MRIVAHLLRVESLLSLVSSESKVESLGPWRIMAIFLLNTDDLKSRPLANSWPRADRAAVLYFSLSFHARSVRVSFSTLISRWSFIDASTRVELKSPRVSHCSSVGWSLRDRSRRSSHFLICSFSCGITVLADIASGTLNKTRALMGFRLL